MFDKIKQFIAVQEIRFQEWIFKKLCCFTPEQVGLLAAHYEMTTGKDPLTISDKDV